MTGTDRDRETAPSAGLVLSQEQLSVSTRWVRSGTLRVRRRVVSETRTVEVTVRRTELVLDSDDIEFSTDGGVTTGIGTARGTDAEGAAEPAAREPLVIVLAQEEPQVTTVVRPYERVTVTVDRVTGTEQVNAELEAEHVDLDVSGTESAGLPSER